MFTFGVLSDVQYADHDDALPPYPPARKRYYRGSLDHVQKALVELNDCNTEFVLQLGDIIDGKCKSNSMQALQKVLDIFTEGDIPVHHTLGNHDLYNFTHQQAADKIVNGVARHAPFGRAYYSFVSHGLRFINIDTYDVAVLGRDSDDPSYDIASTYLSANPNQDRNSPTGLEGGNRRFVKYNGGLGVNQIAWLTAELREAEQANQAVIIFGHCGFSPLGSYKECILWNYQDALELLENSPCVKLVLSGHGHHYLHGVSATGKHYITLRAVVETPPGEKSWMIVESQPEQLRVMAYNGADVDEFAIEL